MKRFNYLLGGLLVAQTALAQLTPSENIAKYPGEFAVRLLDHTLVDISVKKGALEIEENYNYQTLFLDNRASQQGNISLEYEPEFSEIEKLKAYTLVPEADKDEYRKEKVRDVSDELIVAQDIFYSGSRGKIFNFPSLQKGAIACMTYTKIHKLPYLLGAEVFNDHVLRADHLLQISHDAEVVMDFAYFNCDESYFEYSKQEKSGQIIHTWKPKKYSKLQSEPGMPSSRSISPHIIYRVVSYKDGDKDFPVLRNTADLFKWYYSLLTEVKSDKCIPLDQLTDSITAGTSDDLEKTRRIFNWVQQNIKYIAFESGIEGFQPRLPSAVYSKRFGDCKDMASIMINMLTHAGIPAYHTWIGTRDLPYSYTDVPSPLADNHMIATAHINGEYIFLDATSAYLPFPLPSSFIQGKEALIGLGEDEFIIRKVPVMQSMQNSAIDSVHMKIEDNTISGSGIKHYTGYFADEMNAYYNSKNSKWLNDVLKDKVSKGNNKCRTINPQLSKKQETAVINYEFEVPEYAYTHDNKILLNLNLEKPLSSLSLKDDRIHPRENRHTFHLSNIYTLEVPEGYKVEYIPAGQEYTSSDDFSFKIDYQLTDNVLRYTLTVDVNYLLLQPEQFEQWNAMIKELNRNYSETLILTKKS